MNLIVTVDHKPEHWNFNCRATIPEYWIAEVENIEVLTRKIGVTRFYAEGETRQEAINNIKAELQSCGLTGRMKLV